MEQAIRFLLSNFTLTLFVVGLVAALVAPLRRETGMITGTGVQKTAFPR